MALSSTMKWILSIFCCFFLASPAMAKSLSPGDMAPDFSLPDQQNISHRLSAYRGHWIVLYFYPRDETPGCTKEACSFRDNISALSDRGAVVLGVSVDDSRSHAEFATRHHLPFPLLSDNDGEVARNYGSLLNLLVFKVAKRHSFIIDPEGRIAKIYRDVDPVTHVSDIVEELGRLRLRRH